MINRVAGTADVELAFTPLEIDLLRWMPKKRGATRSMPHLRDGLTQLAKLGGYLARGRDGPPGNMVIWRGMRRLTDIAIGYQMAMKDVGN
jgi:Transposase Tn5 dimerisation domain